MSDFLLTKMFVIYCFEGNSHYLERLRSGASRRHSPLSHCHWPSNPWTCHYCYRGNPSAGYSANKTPVQIDYGRFHVLISEFAHY